MRTRPSQFVAVGTCVSSHAPRTEPYVRLSRIRLPPRVCDGESGRIRPSAFVTRAWLWVQYVLCWCVFPLAPALRSTDSAALAPADASAVGFLRFVRRLHCCRVGGGALDCSRAGLRPPPKLDVQFSRIQLSRRRCPLSSDGRDQRDKIDKPELAVELAGWQRCPTAAAPFPEPVRPDSSHQPAVESVDSQARVHISCDVWLGSRARTAQSL